MSVTSGSQLVVIKIGGNALVNDNSLELFSNGVKDLLNFGYKVVITHGGGPQITETLEKAGVISEFRNGYRVSTAEVVEVVREVLCNDIQPKIVNSLYNLEIDALGICGSENYFLCHKKIASGTSDDDLGFVGEIDEVRVGPLIDLLSQGITPVVSVVGTDMDNNFYNINADSGAAAIASALMADALCLLTDVQGVYESWPDEASVISDMDLSKLNALIDNVDRGMIPKLQSAKQALLAGVNKVFITSGNDANAIVDIFIKGDSVGTRITL